MCHTNKICREVKCQATFAFIPTLKGLGSPAHLFIDDETKADA